LQIQQLRIAVRPADEGCRNEKYRKDQKNRHNYAAGSKAHYFYEYAVDILHQRSQDHHHSERQRERKGDDGFRAAPQRRNREACRDGDDDHAGDRANEWVLQSDLDQPVVQRVLVFRHGPLPCSA